jgi:hypothetical protein
MLNPIKRVWIPKKVEASVPAAPIAATVKPQPAPKRQQPRNGLFDAVPEPEVEEKNSDSIWAEFTTQCSPETQNK